MVDKVNSLEELGQGAEGVEAPVAVDAPVITRESVKDALGRSYATGKRSRLLVGLVSSMLSQLSRAAVCPVKLVRLSTAFPKHCSCLTQHCVPR